jgi:hypothetical protein
MIFSAALFFCAFVSLRLYGAFLFSQHLEDIYSNYSGGDPVSILWQQSYLFPPSMARMSQQRQPSLLSPHLRQYGGCSRVCRRNLWRKIRTTVAIPVLAAVHFGDKVGEIRQSRHNNFSHNRSLHYLEQYYACTNCK